MITNYIDIKLPKLREYFSTDAQLAWIKWVLELFVDWKIWFTFYSCKKLRYIVEMKLDIYIDNFNMIFAEDIKDDTENIKKFHKVNSRSLIGGGIIAGAGVVVTSMLGVTGCMQPPQLAQIGFSLSW